MDEVRPEKGRRKPFQIKFDQRRSSDNSKVEDPVNVGVVVWPV
jgi:hypothetical protein